MEGRTIVRPDPLARALSHQLAAGFNGGPDNCPARPRTCKISVGCQITASMEGRTIVRPDHIDESALSAARGASMEGRTIVRPDPSTGPLSAPTGLCFNGGPDNCPARPRSEPDPQVTGHDASMEGRTIVRPDSAGSWPTSSGKWGFNGGPDNCPARREQKKYFGPKLSASMEGRTIVRPDSVDRGPVTVGVGHASMEGRTIVRPDKGRSISVGLNVNGFNGGPDNCPARPRR